MATVKGAWQFNENIDFTARFEENVNFTWGGERRTAIRMYDDSDLVTNPNTYLSILTDGTWTYIRNDTNATWFPSGTDRVIDFGSTEQPVSDYFYTWLTANATQQVEEVKTVKGVWKFNESITTPDVDVYVNFVSDETNFISVSIGRNTLGYGFLTAKDQSGTEAKMYHAYTYNGWQNDFYRVWDFGTTEQPVSDEFYTWLTANATQQSGGEDSGGEDDSEDATGRVTISYNGKEIATFSTGKIATLECAGKKMVGDIVIAYGDESGGGEDSGFDVSELIGVWLLNEDIEYYSLSGANFHKDVTINVSGTFYGWKRYSTISERSNTDLTRIVFNGAYDGTNGSENYPRGRLTFYNDNQKYTNSAGSTYTQCTRWLRGGALVDYVTECHMWAVNAEDKKYYFEVVSDSYYKRSARHLTISSIGDNSTEDLRMVLAWLKANAVKQGDETGGSSN